MHSKLTEFAFDYPHLIDFFDIGTSVNGLNLLAVRITNKHNVDPLKPKVRYIGNMHGDEALSRQLLIKLIIYLVEHYESDWNVYQILNTTEVYILPTMNPDGYANSDEGTCLPSSYKIAGPYTRHNANGIDLNRDFPVLSRKPITRCQPETRAVIEWAKSVPFLLSANFHGGALLVSYPLDFLFYNGSSDCSDNDLVENIAKIYADNHRGGMARRL
ncbi:hypothetical protein GJ496_011838 [Pomphorhynchus laevis]|nr:hypothetical protein GJ496_011838 [Pomphorhynchus laevis]